VAVIVTLLIQEVNFKITGPQSMNRFGNSLAMNNIFDGFFICVEDNGLRKLNVKIYPVSRIQM